MSYKRGKKTVTLWNNENTIIKMGFSKSFNILPACSGITKSSLPQLAWSGVDVCALIKGSSEPIMKYKQRLRLTAEMIAEGKEEGNF